MADESANTPSKRARNAATNAVASGKGTSSVSASSKGLIDSTPSSVYPRSTSVANLIVHEQTAGSPQIGEKRKRGRPRKSIEESIPEPSDEPKRGRGRPRKVLSEADLAAAAAATASPAAKRGRGRPRKEPGT